MGTALIALGVVYGDIGTSPLYAFRESMAEGHGIPVSVPNVLGTVSVIIWSLVIVITVKYIALVMRADNHGEGGILVLASLIPRGRSGERRRLWLALGLFGTALLYGDGAITPAISVLSAVEGLAVVTPTLARYVVPISIGVLCVLFAAQRNGTERIGRVFGPVMTVWFLVLIVLGVSQIVRRPDVLAAFDPRHAVRYFVDFGFPAFRSLGAIFLVITGGEALYADMGHFGRRPIALGWVGLVLPALVVTYLGQGALLMRTPGAIENPFFRMAPSWALVPLVVLATAATVIASQALISGAFSLTLQAVRLDVLPRLSIRQTSPEHRGQVYVPVVNWILMVASIGLVIGFGTSARLAGAYGVAVTTTMVITTLLFGAFARLGWGWSITRTLMTVIPLLAIDLAFLGAGVLKIPHGGWVPLVAAVILLAVMTTWQRGHRATRAALRVGALPLGTLLGSFDREDVVRVPGTAIYLNAVAGTVPPALLANLRAHRVLRESVILLTVQVRDVPRIQAARRCRVTKHRHDFTEIVMWFGFSEATDVATALHQLDDPVIDESDTVYFLGKEVIGQPTARGRWRVRLFAVLHRNAQDAAAHFRLPADRVYQVGRVVDADGLAATFTRRP